MKIPLLTKSDAKNAGLDLAGSAAAGAMGSEILDVVSGGGGMGWPEAVVAIVAIVAFAFLYRKTIVAA